MVRLLSGRGRETAQWAGAGEVLAVHLSLVAGTHIKEREEPHHGVVPRLPHECCGMNAHAHTHPHTLREKQSFKGIGVGWSFSFLKWYLFVCVTIECVYMCACVPGGPRGSQVNFWKWFSLPLVEAPRLLSLARCVV